MKRMIACLLTMCLLLAYIPPIAFAAIVVDSGSCGDNVTWSLDENGLLTISGSGAMYDYEWGKSPFNDNEQITDVVIEDGVTTIGEGAFLACGSLTSIAIPNSVISIGDNAFRWCSSLTSVVIPDSVNSIGAEAFFYCNSLTSIVIPDSITSIGDGVFVCCYSLEKIEVAEGNPNYYSDTLGVLFNKEKTTLISAPGVISGEYIIPDSVTSISNYAFSSCSNLTSIVIPDSITSIGNDAFSSCRSITSIIIPDSVISIGNSAFSECTNLTSIILPSSLITIGDFTFYSCLSLTNIVIPASVTSIGLNAFYNCDSLTSIVIPDSVTSINDYAFQSCSSLQKFEVAEENSYFSNDAAGILFDKEKTALIDAPDTISGEYIIPDGVVAIRDYAFAYSDNLTGITIPNSVTSIGFTSFMACYNLTSIIFKGNAPVIGAVAFLEVTAEVSYPGNNSSWTEDVMQDYGGTLTWTPYETSNSAFVGNSLSLNGDIGGNFYVSLTDELLADENLRMVFNVGDTAQEMTLADAVTSEQEDGTVWYRFSCSLPAKSMADQVVAQLYGTDGAVGDSKTYSIAQYYSDICQQFSREDKPELFAMVEAMLNYGAAAQEYFGYNTDALANAAVTAAVLDDIDASAYAAVVSDSDTLLDYAGMSLVLESNTALRVFFRAVNGADLSDYVFTIGGEAVPPVQKDSLWYVELSGIAAKDLDTVCTITAGDVTVECSALSYVCSVLQKADALDERLVSLCKALFTYNQTADAYFATQN